MNPELENEFKIYFDRFQCAEFSFPYFENHKFSLRADAILRSKDYDKRHTDYLSSMGSRTLFLERVGHRADLKTWDSPGWYRVTSIE